MGLVDEHLGASMHVNLSLRRGSENAFAAANAGPRRGLLMRRWVAGLLATMPGAMSFFSPTVNSYRRLVEIAGPPTTVTWGATTSRPPCGWWPTIRRRRGSSTGCRRSTATRTSALAAILAGGLVGMEPTSSSRRSRSRTWRGACSTTRRRASLRRSRRRPTRWPPTIACASCSAAEGVDYWLGSRRWEWLAFHRNGGDPDAVSDFELSRYFEHV